MLGKWLEISGNEAFWRTIKTYKSNTWWSSLKMFIRKGHFIVTSHGGEFFMQELDEVNGSH